MGFRRGLAAAAAGVLPTLALWVAPAHGAVTLLRIGSFADPVFVTAPPGDTGRVFVVEKAGVIQDVRGATRSVFLDISGKVVHSGQEQGLLSMAFAPDYATSGKFYVYYTAAPAGPPSGQSDLVISEFRRTDADHADPATEREVLRIPHRLEGNHNGGQLQFGPDGLLYIATGDGGAGNDLHGNAQQTTNAGWYDPAVEHDARLGKLLRIDPAAGSGCDGGCTIPADNPGFGQPEIWAYGLRNPWRFSFDRSSGDLVLGDVGQAQWEEIDFAAAPGRGRGANFGWPLSEGAHDGPSSTPAPGGCCLGPVIEKSHGTPDNFISITGGYVVRDPALGDLLGRYLYADYVGGEIRAATFTAAGAVDDRGTGLKTSNLSSFGEDACGRVYVTSLQGAVYRLAQSGDCVPPPAAGGGTTPSVDPPPGGGSTGAPDTKAPTVTVRAAATQRPWRTGVVRLQVSCDEICTVAARGSFLVARRTARAAAAVVPLRTPRVRARLAAGARVSLKLKVSGTARRSLLRSIRRGRRVTVRFAVDAKDQAGNVRRSTKTSRIVRR
jgi:glucose/arabinose dehydrogenase